MPVSQHSLQECGLLDELDRVSQHGQLKIMSNTSHSLCLRRFLFKITSETARIVAGISAGFDNIVTCFSLFFDCPKMSLEDRAGGLQRRFLFCFL